MGIWLQGYAGDNAGKYNGRETNRLLVALTHTDGTFPPGLFEQGSLAGIPWYFNLYVAPLMRGAREAIATTVEEVGDYVWSIEVAEVDWGSGKAAWTVGLQLFSVMLLAPGGHQSGTIASTTIDANLKRIAPEVQDTMQLAARRIRRPSH